MQPDCASCLILNNNNSRSSFADDIIHYSFRWLPRQPPPLGGGWGEVSLEGSGVRTFGAKNNQKNNTARLRGGGAFFCVLEIKLYICTKQDIMTQVQNRMTNLQFEIVKMFNYELNSNELVEIKNLLANYFQNKIDRSMDKLWTDKGWTNDTMLQILNEHPKR
jgi:hypothetical protein